MRIPLDSKLMVDLYGNSWEAEGIPERIQNLVQELDRKPDAIISAPGRTELGGNHTDHQHGKVLCASVQKDTLAVVARRDDNIARLHSQNFEETYEANLESLDMREEEQGTSTAILRGVLAGMRERGKRLGGFDAVLHSNVGIGSGLSSSASFEVGIASILNELYNDGIIPAPELARIGQYAENVYFGKPCGLMDQMSSAVGGILMIDFADPNIEKLQSVNYDFKVSDYMLCLVHTGSDHKNLTPAYASIPEEMFRIAKALGVSHLQDIDQAYFKTQLKVLKEKSGDRSVLRALHFFKENERVDRMVKALINGDLTSYMQAVSESSISSSTILQNTIPSQSDGQEQSLALALGLSRQYFDSAGRGVSRVHGGGFAGAMQAYVHRNDLSEFKSMMEEVYGVGAFEEIKVRDQGVINIL